MKKRLSLLLALLIFSLFISGAFAEIIKLKSGRQIQGEIVEKTNSYIKVDVAGVPLTYFLDDISAIESEQPSPPKPQAAVTGASAVDSYNEAWRKEFERQKPDWKANLIRNLKFDRIKGIYLIIFPLAIFLSLFFGFSPKAIFILGAGLVMSLIARTVFNNPSAANLISYIFILFTVYRAMKSEVFRN